MSAKKIWQLCDYKYSAFKEENELKLNPMIYSNWTGDGLSR